MINIQNITYTYPRHKALRDVSFSVKEKTIAALVGPNGAGKTTLLHCLTTLKKPIRGSIDIGNLDVIKQPYQSRKAIGFLSDFFGLYDDLTVKQALLYFARAYRVEKEQESARVAEVVDQLNLQDKLDGKCGSLSRGERQRVAIGQAMIHDPKYLFLDEPASGLDPEARLNLSELLLNLQKRGMTIIVSSHILAELDQYANQIIILKNGRVVESSINKETIDHKTQLDLRLMELPDNFDDIIKTVDNVKLLKIENNSVSIGFTGSENQQHDFLKLLINAGVKIVEFKEKKENIQEQYLRAVNH